VTLRLLRDLRQDGLSWRCRRMHRDQCRLLFRRLGGGGILARVGVRWVFGSCFCSGSQWVLCCEYTRGHGNYGISRCRSRNSPLTLSLSRGARGVPAAWAMAAGPRGRNGALPCVGGVVDGPRASGRTGRDPHVAPGASLLRVTFCGLYFGWLMSVLVWASAIPAEAGNHHIGTPSTYR